MLERYQRCIPALSESELSVLRGKSVLVAGCGGLGGYIIEYLARLGVGRITVIDGDSFEPTNLNRQMLCESALMGVSKALTARERILRVNPDIEVEAIHAFLNQDNADSLIQPCDVVLDALDNVSARRILISTCMKKGIPCVYGAIRGWVAQAALLLPGETLMDWLFNGPDQIADRSVLSFTPALCASMQVSLCIRHLCEKPVESGKIFFFDLQTMEFETIPLSVP
ncbi:MAG: HesA/MoeB/ThiF family protein [Christensenellales bacterium]|nr:HesA/MoeB/ThiF family protein [Christensenellales bacterium]